ncbi:Flp pilus assembly protein CpaB [Aliidiomarina celeris]|uniref:Flp pilus assembly protein CpaB n=1 Tax=Aliidiomarina celeris TaxID=2249428 RepID=UPI000DE930A7|nr:Flp pilus assembly protein CpaB [Aliidiomarina celeris]
MNIQGWIKRIPLWFVAPLLFGLVAAAVTWWLVERYLAQQIALQPRLPPLPVEEQLVLVARSNLSAGAELTVDQLATRSLEARTLPADAILPEAFEQVQQRFLAYPVRAGKALQWLHLVDESAMQLSQQLAPQMRAFTVAVQNDWTHVQQLQVGDRVDFYEQREQHWQQLTPAVEVLRVHTDFITFAVPEQQIALLTERYEQQQLRFVVQGVDQEAAAEKLNTKGVTRVFTPSNGSL